MTGLTKISHPGHPGHVLKLGPPAEPFKCNACKELGLGPRYSCENRACDFHLHEECGDPPRRRSHPLFPGCTFTLLQASTNRVCDACGKDVLGISYRCDHGNSRKSHDAHPCCLALPSHLSDSGVHLRLAGEVSSRCGRCGRKEAARNVKGWSYVSDEGHCYHVACVKDMVLEKYKEGYFGQKPLSGPSRASSSNNALARTGYKGNYYNSAKVVLKIVTVVIKLVISAIFGNPAAGVAILIESLFT